MASRRRTSYDRFDRVVAIVVLVAFLPQATGCTHGVYRDPGTMPPTVPVPIIVESTTSLQIVGYVTKDGVEHKFQGRVRLGDDGLLHFRPAPTGRPTEQAYGEAFTLPREAVRAVLVEEVTAFGRGAEVGGAVVGGVLVIALISGFVLAAALRPATRSTNSSCPFLYSFDGEGYRLDAEPYGGAIVRNLERTDVCALEHVRAVGDEYRFRLANRMDETQHTNRFTLDVVDHPPGTRVVADGAGREHAFREVAPLAAARDRSGNDLMTLLRTSDRVAWESDLDALAARDTTGAVPAPESIELEFARPPGENHVWLLASVANSTWSGIVLHDWLESYGAGIQGFYAAVQSEAGRDALLAWSAREQLMSLRVEVFEDAGWVREGEVFGGAPWSPETHALPLDVARCRGDRIRVRVQPPAGLWSLNAFELAWDEAPIEVRTLQPTAAVDERGGDVLGAIRSDDAATLDFPTTQSWAAITFPAPPPRAGFDRTVFARVQGWYDVHLESRGAPDAATLAAIRNEPGGFARYAVHRYVERLREISAGTTAPAATTDH